MITGTRDDVVLPDSDAVIIVEIVVVPEKLAKLGSWTSVKLAVIPFGTNIVMGRMFISNHDGGGEQFYRESSSNFETRLRSARRWSR